MYKTYKGIITELPWNGIFVFGSNTQGRHGKGSALVARQKFGAKYGQRCGIQGNSYAIVTKDLTKNIHPSVEKESIIFQISCLYTYARENFHLDFYIAYTGNSINLNGYTPKEMANMFNQENIPNNIIFEEEFAKLIKYGILE
jgi:hypothetical protein